MGSNDKTDKNKNKVESDKVIQVVTADVHRDKDGNQSSVKGKKEESASGQE